jgi:hypothetical protein
METSKLLLRSIFFAVVIIILFNLLLITFFYGNLLIYILICCNPIIIIITLPSCVFFEKLYVKEFVNSGIENEIDTQKYVLNRNPNRTYFYLSGISLLVIIHIITLFYPMIIKPYFQYIYFAPLIWILYPGRWHHDRRTYRQKWIEDISIIPKYGIIILLIIIIYASIIFLFFMGAKGYQFQYFGMLLYELFWIFILSFGAFSSWYGKIGEKVIINGRRRV